MFTKKSFKIDWLDLSPKTMVKIMSLCERYRITPSKAYSFLVDAGAVRNAKPVVRRKTKPTGS